MALILFQISGLWITASANQAKFEHISSAQGLFQSDITAILQDRQGFLWIGTSDGLNRYDGYLFTTYRYDPVNPGSISGNHIRMMVEDHAGRLWLSTGAGGVDCFDVDRGQFRHIALPGDTARSAGNMRITGLLADRRGDVWIGSERGLFHIRGAAGDIIPVLRGNTPLGEVTVMHEDVVGNIWAGTTAALYYLRFDSSATPSQPSIHAFHASSTQYPPRLYSLCDSLLASGQLLAAIDQPGDFQDTTVHFQLSAPRAVVIMCTGEGSAERLLDYGSLRDKNGRPLWEMSYAQSLSGGGAARNRTEIAVVNLNSGPYSLQYRSNRRHSAGSWTDTAPDRPQDWGIRAVVIPQAVRRKIIQLTGSPAQPNTLPNPHITALQSDINGILWIGTANGLARLNYSNLQAPQFSIFKHSPANPNSLADSHIRSIDDGGGLYMWIVTAGGALNRFNRFTGYTHRFVSNPPAVPQDDSRRNDREITSFLREPSGQVWAGTANDGLVSLHIQRQTIATEKSSMNYSLRPREEPLLSHYRSSASSRSSISNNAISALYRDQSGIIWIGTRRGGLNKLRRSKHQFRHYTHIPGDVTSLSEKIVTSIIEDDSGQIWIGTAGGGLNQMARPPAGGEPPVFQHFRHRPSQPNSISSDNITALYEDQNGILWIGTSRSGLDRYDPGDRTFTNFRNSPYKDRSLAGERVNTIYEDQYGQLWIGTDQGLNKFDRFTRKFTVYQHAPGNAASLSDNDVWAIAEDRASRGRYLWVGTRAGGINRFDRSSETFLRYHNLPPAGAAINALPAILSIYQERSGNLFFGTYAGGLHCLDRESGTFSIFTEKDGLANNRVFGILANGENQLWLSTNNGLSCLGIRERRFKNYDINDGLQANEFMPGAFLTAENGEMYFGGVNGITVFHPDSIRENPHQPPIAITELNIFGTPRRDLMAAISQRKTIELPYDQNFLTFEFAALDYHNPSKNRYAYRLDDIHDSWIDIGTRRYASFTDLSPGRYIFRVRGANNDGVWNETGIEVPIVISPPFWKTWWFLSLLSLAVAAASYVIYTLSVRRKVAHALEIEQVRSAENERVRTKAAHDFHDELGHKLTKISLFSEIIRRNLGNSSAELEDYLERIASNAKSLSGGMRDFIWTLDPDKDSLHEVLVHLKDFGDSLFDKTGIAFRMEGMTRGMEDIRLPMDWRRHINLIFKEAMNNALKHARCRNVTLRVAIHDDMLSIALVDDGKGMARGSATTNILSDQSSIDDDRIRGNGVRNMRFRAEKLAGGMEFHSVEGAGTTVIFSARMPRIGN